MSSPAPLKDFWTAARAAANAGELVKITLSKPAYRAEDLPRNRYARLVDIKNRTLLQITHRYEDREEVKNHAISVGLALLERALGDDYYNADLFTVGENISLMMSRKGNARMTRSQLTEARARPAVSLPRTRDLMIVNDHNREKHRDIPADRPYLHDLGVTNASGVVTRDGKRKFKQINKFVEIIAALLREHPLEPGAHIVDMGSGSGYLTFALYDHLVNTLELDVKITGVELRPKLVEKCRTIAIRNGFQNLHFTEGYIDTYQPARLDVLIALHACDTATDDALHQGMKAGAKIMVVAPCCQKQVRRDMVVTEELKPLLSHGIILERQAAMLTDAMRSLLLEAEGYKTKLFEFIALEHTAKNVMITAVRGRKRPRALEEFRALRKRFGVRKHYLRKLIKNGKKNTAPKAE